MNMNKKNIITILLALVAMAGQAQTKKTAIVKGYSPALEDSTVVNIYVDNVSVASEVDVSCSVSQWRSSLKVLCFLWVKAAPTTCQRSF